MTALKSTRSLAWLALAAGLAFVFSMLLGMGHDGIIPLLGAVAVAQPGVQKGATPAAVQQAVPLIPFVQAAHEHVEGAFATVTVQPGASSLDSGPFDVPAYGYIRHVRLEVAAAGGVIGAGVLTPDYPWNLFERLSLLDVNGSPIFELDGYAALWANILGGYVYEQDPRGLPNYVGTTNCLFTIRIPVEINHFDGLGGIANQNAASAYKLSFRTRGSAQLFSTAPTTVPTFTIKAFLEAWSLPNEVDLAGRPQEQRPPMHGTSQYWSSYSHGTVAGANTHQFSRVGNMIRNIIILARNNTMVAGVGTRDDTVFPDPVTFQWDNNQLRQESQRGVVENLHEKITDLISRDAGVFGYSFSHSELGRAGDGPPSLWLATVQSSRIELQGNSATPGALQIITNDIAPVEVDPSQRYDLPNRTGSMTGGAAGAGRVTH